MANLRVGSFGAQVAQIAAPGDLRVGSYGVQIAEIAAAPGTVRVGGYGFQVAQIVSTAGGNLRVGSFGIQAARESVPGAPIAAVLSVFLQGAGFVVLETLAFSSLVPGDSHVETDWLYTTADDLDFSEAVTLTFGVADGEKLTRVIIEGLAAGDYIAKAYHRGETATADQSNVVEFLVREMPASVPDDAVLSVMLEGPDFAQVGVLAMTHPEGVTTPGLFPGVFLPFPELLHLRITPPSGPVFNLFSQEAVSDLFVLIEELEAAGHLVEGRWLEGKYFAFGGYGSVTVTPTGEEEGEPDEEEGVTYETTCDGHTVTITLIQTIPLTTIVWWRVGKATAGGAWNGSENWFDTGSGRMSRTFEVIDPGVRFAVGWRRKKGSVWDLATSFSTPRVICNTPDVAPDPFFVNPPGHPYSENFTLAWDFRGRSDFAHPDLYVYRIRHKPFGAPEEDWETLEEEHEGQSFDVDFVEDLDFDVWHLIGVTTLAPNQESNEALFLFRRRSLANISVRDFKSDSGMPADGLVMHAGAGIGSDRMTFEHLEQLGICLRKTTLNPLEFEPGYLALTNLGLTPLGSRGVLTFSQRVRNEAAWSQYDRFTAVTFERSGIALCLGGNGADKTAWTSLIIRRRSPQEPWGWSGNARSPNAQGGATGANAEYSRTNFGGVAPFRYGRTHDLRVDAFSKRLGVNSRAAVAGSTKDAAELFYPTNVVSGEQTYVLVWEFIKVDGGWTLRFALIGPGLGDGWLLGALTIPDFKTEIGALRELPVGYIGLVAENPVNGGDSIFHSLVVEEITDVPEIISTCPLPPATLTVGYEVELLLDGALPDGWLWEITSGSLPTGLTLNTATGVISGTPTQAGTWRFCVVITNGVEQSNEFCCEVRVSEAGVAGCAREFLVLGSAKGAISTGRIYLPDALDSFTSDLSVEVGTICSIRSKTYAPAGTDGEVTWRRILITGYHRGEVGFWITPILDGRNLQDLRQWLHAPAPQSGRSERFSFLVTLAQTSPEYPNQTQGIRGSALSVDIETTDPVEVWHLETVTFAHEPINTARIRRVGEMEGE